MECKQREECQWVRNKTVYLFFPERAADFISLRDRRTQNCADSAEIRTEITIKAVFHPQKDFLLTEFKSKNSFSGNAAPGICDNNSIAQRFITCITYKSVRQRGEEYMKGQ